MDFAKNYVRGSRARLDFLTKNSYGRTFHRFLQLFSQGNVFDRDNFKFRAKSGIKRSFQSSISIYQKCLNRSVPDSIICVGIGWRQISAFRPLRRYCARLRHRGMLWLVSKDRGAVFYHKLKLKHLSNHKFSHN